MQVPPLGVWQDLLELVRTGEETDSVAAETDEAPTDSVTPDPEPDREAAREAPPAVCRTATPGETPDELSPAASDALYASPGSDMASLLQTVRAQASNNIQHN